MSADITSSNIFFGYYWGVFIPAYEYQRFLKVGLGIAYMNMDLSLKLNLCSKYKVTPGIGKHEGTSKHKHVGECDGKTEIDSI